MASKFEAFVANNFIPGFGTAKNVASLQETIINKNKDTSPNHSYNKNYNYKPPFINEKPNRNKNVKHGYDQPFINEKNEKKIPIVFFIIVIVSFLLIYLIFYK